MSKTIDVKYGVKKNSCGGGTTIIGGGSTGTAYIAGQYICINGSSISAISGTTVGSLATGNHIHSIYATASNLTGSTLSVPVWSGSSCCFMPSPIAVVANTKCVTIGGVPTVAGYHLTTCNIFGCTIMGSTFYANTYYSRCACNGCSTTISVYPNKCQSIKFNSIYGATPSTSLILCSGGTAHFTCCTYAPAFCGSQCLSSPVTCTTCLQAQGARIVGNTCIVSGCLCMGEGNIYTQNLKVFNSFSAPTLSATTCIYLPSSISVSCGSTTGQITASQGYFTILADGAQMCLDAQGGIYAATTLCGGIIKASCLTGATGQFTALKLPTITTGCALCYNGTQVVGYTPSTGGGACICASTCISSPLGKLTTITGTTACYSCFCGCASDSAKLQGQSPLALTLTSGCLVYYNGTTLISYTGSTGGGSGVSYMCCLCDACISTPTCGQTLQYNSTSGKWTNSTTLDICSNLTSGKVLYWNGSTICTCTPTGYILPVQALCLAAPVDGCSYYFGAQPAAPSLTAGLARIYVPKAGAIKTAHINTYAGTAGTAEAWCAYIVLNGSTCTLIQCVAASTASRTWCNTGLSISVAQNDYVQIKMISPAWSTNPANVCFSGVIYIE